LVIDRVGRRPWLAFLVALLAVLVPGMTFKNYMPLLAVANACCLLQFALGPGPRRRDVLTPADDPLLAAERPPVAWAWLCIGGIVLGLTFLIRIDVGTF